MNPKRKLNLHDILRKGLTQVSPALGEIMQPAPIKNKLLFVLLTLGAFGLLAAAIYIQLR